jgi:hypothetical protein
MFLMTILILMMTVGLVLGRVTVKAKSVEMRAIGIMADLPCARCATDPARTRTTSNHVYISGPGQRVHHDLACPTTRRSWDLKEWQICGVFGQLVVTSGLRRERMELFRCEVVCFGNGSSAVLEKHLDEEPC